MVSDRDLWHVLASIRRGTRMAQGGVSKAPAARHCGFESHLRHNLCARAQEGARGSYVTSSISTRARARARARCPVPAQGGRRWTRRFSRMISFGWIHVAILNRLSSAVTASIVRGAPFHGAHSTIHPTATPFLVPAFTVSTSPSCVVATSTICADTGLAPAGVAGTGCAKARNQTRATVTAEMLTEPRQHDLLSRSPGRS